MIIKKILNYILISLFLTMILTNSFLFTRICANGSGGGYGDGEISPESSSGIVSDLWIEIYVIEGAKYFLTANSDIMTFLNRVENSELQGMNFIEARQILDRAYLNMQYAISLYDGLIWLAERTPYNERVQEKLLNFDYDSFMGKNGLNGVIFNEVKGFLGNGDITGVYRNIHSRFNAILGIIASLRADIHAGKIPAISKCWDLTDACSQTLMFGEYVSRVFYSFR